MKKQRQIYFFLQICNWWCWKFYFKYMWAIKRADRSINVISLGKTITVINLEI